MVKFGVVVTPFWPVSFIVDYLCLAEQYGFEFGWVSESPSTEEIYSTLSLAATKTKKIKLGTCTTNPYLRHPLVTASSIATLDEISKGRAVLGIAAGDYATLKSLNIVRKMPLKMMKESIELIRRALSGKRFDFDGELLKVSNFQLVNPPKRMIPIYVGARGPSMSKLAGEIGDGVIIDASHPIEVELSLKNVKIGLKASKRINKDFEMATCAQVGVSGNEEEARNSARWIVALISAGSSKEVQARHGIKQEDVEKIKDALLKEDFNKAYELVNDEMI
ncbi:MAG: 5,10-methylenetetrahydromethanopterin reductase, partial [Candidatus Bathyarchaeia archaeon]